MLVHKLGNTVTVGLDTNDGFATVLLAFTERDMVQTSLFFTPGDGIGALSSNTMPRCLALVEDEVEQLRQFLNEKFSQQPQKAEATQYERFVDAVDGITGWDDGTMREIAAVYGIDGAPDEKPEHYDIGRMRLVASSPHSGGACLYFDTHCDGVTSNALSTTIYSNGVLFSALVLEQLRDAIDTILNEAAK